MGAWSTALDWSDSQLLRPLHYARNLGEKGHILLLNYPFFPLYPMSKIHTVHTPPGPWNLLASLVFRKLCKQGDILEFVLHPETRM